MLGEVLDICKKQSKTLDGCMSILVWAWISPFLPCIWRHLRAKCPPGGCTLRKAQVQKYLSYSGGTFSCNRHTKDTFWSSFIYSCSLREYNLRKGYSWGWNFLRLVLPARLSNDHLSTNLMEGLPELRVLQGYPDVPLVKGVCCSSHCRRRWNIEVVFEVWVKGCTERDSMRPSPHSIQ